MRFAVNYSPQAEALLQAGTIQVDLWKCPDWPGLLAQAGRSRPVYVHFPLNLGAGEMASHDWGEVERWRQETGTPYVNLHLIAKAGDVARVLVDSREADDLDRVAAHLVREVAPVVDRFGPEAVIVENVIYRGGGFPVLYGAVAPEVITRVVRETGCGLLLDTAHAQVTAKYLGIDPRAYLAALPGDALRELHVTGTAHDGERWRDHLALSEEDFDLVEWVVGQIEAGEWARPWVTAFEYGGIGPKFEWRSEERVLAEQAPRLCRLLTGR